MPPSISLRPIGPEDEAFLYRVYASTRADELAPLGWDEAQQTAFLRMQFAAQHQYYHAQFPNAGLGSALLGELLAEADRAGKPVRLHVEPFNPALRLYQRLGFTHVGDAGVYWFMERWPEAKGL